ncbi:hypothetical protein [Paludibacterium denitrificans]|uniref:Uncharacterized protein n=1 Tax=Paludibacterium denitrificans TaxID=2675226 RepID=A0A844GC70_9NEIS|nr:hypothetical protein [Paludibacterium denitrificans]MTD32828.1 hypothetical protein [Paludibacterium denitrificans]
MPSRQQWLRVDATAAIAPNRVEQSIEQSVAGAAETLPLTHRAVPGWWLAARQNWQTAAFVWQQWVVGYDAQRQQSVYQRTGVGAAC